VQSKRQGTKETDVVACDGRRLLCGQERGRAAKGKQEAKGREEKRAVRDSAELHVGSGVSGKERRYWITSESNRGEMCCEQIQKKRGSRDAASYW
jgi:hypothetical protein